MKKATLIFALFFILFIFDVNAFGLNNNSAIPNINQSNLTSHFRMNATSGNQTDYAPFRLNKGLSVTGTNIKYAVPDPYTTPNGSFAFLDHTNQYLSTLDNVNDYGFSGDFCVMGWVQHDVDFATEAPSEQWLFNCIDKDNSAGRPHWGIHSESPNGYINLQYSGADKIFNGNNTFSGGRHHHTLNLRGTNLSYLRDGVLLASTTITVADLPPCLFHINVQYQSGSHVGGGKNLNFSDVVILSRSCAVDTDVMCMYNGSNCLNVTIAPDTTLPTIINYSDQGSSCSNWNTNPSNPCSTSDTTPTLYFNTSEAAYCAIGLNNFNYTAIGSLRNCTSGENTIEHACTLIDGDELVYEDSIVYLSCKDSSGNMNTTSTSGPLSLTITGLETSGDATIGAGIQNALLSGYTNYTEVQIYTRNLSNGQVKGTFDRMAKKGSKAWAFNFVSKGEQHVNMFNLTPVLYVLEMSNITSTNITKTIELMINATK
ncbi:hypothetical protein J4204_01710 [Candidatus Woesearchaeota archaeon]|nr:hypothetical protein [Candidatus Woesearchaeota archaeon]